MWILFEIETDLHYMHLIDFFYLVTFYPQMQQRNTAVVDMEAKLNDMKSKSEEYTDKVKIFSCCCHVNLDSW